MRKRKKIQALACLMCLGWSGLEAVAQPDDGSIWHGSMSQWEQIESTWHLNATEAGQAWLYTCLDNVESTNDSMGRSVRLRWAPSFSGSNNNFSRLHFFSLSESEANTTPPFPISGWTASDNALAPGSFLHLGRTGNQDPLEWRQILDSTAAGDAFPVLHEMQPGLFAEGMDVWLEWGQLPGDSIATLTLEPVGADGPSIPVYTALHPLPTCIGLSVQFTTSNTEALQFQLEQMTAFIPDTVSPRIHQTTWEGDTVLVWHFDEPIRSHIGSIESVLGLVAFFPAFPNSTKTLRMSSDPHWIAGTSREFNLVNFTDLAGNMLADTAVHVIWSPANSAQRGDIVLTEIMADPTPHEDLPDCEWAEVLNRSNRHFDVQFWHWWDEGSSELIQLVPRPPWDGFLHPGDRVLISGCDEAVLDGAAPEAHIDGAAAFNDAGDGLGLIRSDGMLLDAIHYRQTWWEGDNGGVSLQVIHPGACAANINWQRSQAAGGCTPGTPSEQEISTPLENNSLIIEQLVPTSKWTGFIDFNEAIDPLSTATITPHGSVTWTLDEIHPNRLHWHLRIAAPDPAVRFQISPLKVCLSDWSTGSEFTFKVDLETAKFPEPGDLVIAEISCNPQGSTADWGEFVELCNAHESMAIEMGGIQCGDWTFNERHLLQPGERIVVYPGNLPNEKGTIAVRNASGSVLDEVRYSACWHPNRKQAESGFSLIRVDLQGPSQNSENWTSSGHPLGASPGTSDAAEALGSWLQRTPSDAFQGRFLMHGATATDTYFLFSQPVWIENSAFRPVGSQEAVDWFEFADAQRVWAQPSTRTIPDSILATDGHGQTQWIEIQSIPFNQEALETGMRLNEVLETDALGEPFIEVTHTQPHFVGTSNWLISTESIPFPSDWKSLSPGVNWQLPPNEPWAFAACPNRLRTARALPVDLPSLYGREYLHLQSPEQTIESVFLSPDLDAPWAVRHVTSLERMHEKEDASWQSSSDPSGSTPGERNSWSQAMTTSSPAQFPFIEIIQRTWSSHSPMPRAVLFALHPGEEQTAWKAHVAIVSASGHILWRLADEPWLAFEQPAWLGAWDGRNEHGILAAPGSYLLQVIFENAATGHRRLQVAPIHMAPSR
jgi:hypothetical protein